MPRTKRIAKVNSEFTSSEKRMRTLIHSRDNPAQTGRSLRNAPYRINTDTTDLPLGRVVLSLFTYTTRISVLNLSYVNFSELLIEDHKRRILLKGRSLEEANKLYMPISFMTIQRVERSEGMTTEFGTILALSGRILNPETGKAFEAIQLQEVLQDLDERITREYVTYIKSEEYIKKSKDLQKQIDYTLAYRLSLD
jgi:hypothetical protein